MKVLHTAQRITGGVASYFSEILPLQIRDLGSDNVVVLVAADEFGELPDIPRANLRSFASSVRKPWALLQMGWTLDRLVRRERPDIIHIHSTYAGFVVRLRYAFTPAARRPRLLYCSHGWSFNMQVSPRMQRAYAAIERWLARTTDAIACISQYEHRRALDYGLPAAKLRLIYNGIAADVPPRALEGAQPVFSPDRLNLLFLGRQDRQKGFDLLAAAMARLLDHPVHLHAVGASVLSQPSDQRDAANITQHGWQPRDRIVGFIEAADVVVMPSRWEGFGLVAAEAMRQRRAVCAADVDALPELVREGVSGHLFAPEDVDALVALIGTLDRGELRTLGETARAWFLDNFTADRTHAELLALYAEVMAAR